MSTSFFKAAREAYDSGDFARAVGLYRQAIRERPALAATYELGLRRAEEQLARLGQTAPAESLRAGETSAHLRNLYAHLAANGTRNAPPATKECPLVTVLMTAHNVDGHVEEAVISVLRQTYGRVELIVVDDSSSDGTWEVLKALRRGTGIVVRRLNANLGTYFAKNYGLQLARGEFVFFQDADDISHPERIRLMMQQLDQPGVVCARGAYSRVLYPSGRILPINGLASKIGLVTLGVRRKVFDEVGYFNCTMKASDDEFFQRIERRYAQGPDAIAELDLPLYYNTYRDGSLFTDMIANDPVAEGSIRQELSPVRAQYLEAFRSLHNRVAPTEYPQHFTYPRIRDLVPVPAEMSRLANPEIPVVAALCSIPERAARLERVVRDLLPQVDELHVYLDRYAEVPAYLKQNADKVVVRTSKEHPGLRDNAKFLPLLGLTKPCYYLTLDDDLYYPPDYVNALLKKLQHYENQVVVGVHGVLLPEYPTGYFSGFRRVLMFNHAQTADALVNNLGTGTVAFHSTALAGLDYRRFEHAGMVDLYLSAFCRQQGVPMVAIARHDDWVHEPDAPTQTLYDEFKADDAMQTALVKRGGPWGYAAIADAVEQLGRRQPDRTALVERLRAMIPPLRACLW